MSTLLHLFKFGILTKSDDENEYENFLCFKVIMTVINNDQSGRSIPFIDSAHFFRAQIRDLLKQLAIPVSV